MKKLIKILSIITVVFIIVCFVDIMFILNMSKPIIVLKKDNYKYSGLLFNVYNCPENSASQIKAKWVKYSCAVSRQDLGKVINIIDKTKNIEDFACAEVLESFYEDEANIYYYSCLKGKYIKVKYESGYEETVENALKYKTISISDLDKYHISYITSPKNIISYIELNKKEKCNEKDEIYYKKGDIALYTKCIEEIYVTKNNQKISLKEYLKTSDNIRNSMGNITNLLKNEIVIRDGGSKLYTDDGTKKYTNSNMHILVCNNIDGNKNIYISEEGIEANKCQNKEE